MPTLRIVSVNDVYSLEALPRLASLIRRQREGVDVCIAVLAGDFLSPSLLSSLDGGRGMVDCLNATGITHVILGNHEADLDDADLVARLADLSCTCIGTNVGLALPRHDVIDVKGVRVGLVGVVMTDPAVYRRTPFGGVTPANEAALAETERLLGTCRSVVAITHQPLAADRDLARAGRHSLIVGGHEHRSMLVEEGAAWIVKSGMDAAHAVVSDLELDHGKVSVRLVDTAPFPEDEEVRARVDHHLAPVRELSAATLFLIPPGTTLSSVGTRAHQTTMGTFVCTRLRESLGADACLFNGGGIRGAKAYSDRFTYGDVEAELPFPNEIVVVPLPGHVIQDAIRASRSAESGAYLQVDDGMVIEGHRIATVAGHPFDENRTYSVAIVRELLLGLDNVEPLVRWTKEHPEILPPPDSGTESKLLFARAFALELWEHLGGFDAIDANKDDRITPSEVEAAVARTPGGSPLIADLVMRAVDIDEDRVITREDEKTARRK
jgi:2',3'-cyclic-nucleotide 2'-phosphodiesterase (5'-nucleotidase family)